jgi:hypothetical protein
VERRRGERRGREAYRRWDEKGGEVDEGEDRGGAVTDTDRSGGEGREPEAYRLMYV